MQFKKTNRLQGSRIRQIYLFPLTIAQQDKVIDTPTDSVPDDASYPQKVYIQFAGRLDRSDITALNKALKAEQWNVQGNSGEYTPNAAKSATVLWAGNNQAAAQELTDALNRSGLNIRQVSPRYNAAVLNTLEVWISSP